jgi:hypothetical protein
MAKCPLVAYCFVLSGHLSFCLLLGEETTSCLAQTGEQVVLARLPEAAKSNQQLVTQYANNNNKIIYT